MRLTPKVKVVPKPWGREEWWAQGPGYVCKFLHIRKGHRLSKQYHEVKHETLYTLKGRWRLEVGSLRRTRKRILSPGSVVQLPPRTVHRMEAAFGDVVLVEASTPQVWDVVRLADDYGRDGSKKGKEKVHGKRKRR